MLLVWTQGDTRTQCSLHFSWFCSCQGWRAHSVNAESQLCVLQPSLMISPAGCTFCPFFLTGNAPPVPSECNWMGGQEQLCSLCGAFQSSEKMTLTPAPHQQMERNSWNQTPLTHWPQTGTQSDFPVPCPQINDMHSKVLSEEVRQINGKIRTIFAAWIQSRTTLCILLK